MALTALLARRNDTRTTVRAIAAGGFVTLAAQVRDALRPPEASIWHMVFAKPDTGSQYGTDLVMLADDRTIVVTADSGGIAGAGHRDFGGVAYPIPRLGIAGHGQGGRGGRAGGAAQDRDRQSAAGRRDRGRSA